jgi:hypothetical protein
MRIYFDFCIALIIVTGFACVCSECVVDDDFLGDLSSEDNRIAGELYLDVFSGNLSSLSYDYYIKYVSDHEAQSAKGLASKIQCSNKQYFKSSKEGFLILLLYKDTGKIIGDRSSTSVIDTLITLNNNTAIPDLDEVAKKMNFE